MWHEREAEWSMRVSSTARRATQRLTAIRHCTLRTLDRPAYGYVSTAQLCGGGCGPLGAAQITEVRRGTARVNSDLLSRMTLLLAPADVERICKHAVASVIARYL